jgi:hypothetical protein
MEEAITRKLKDIMETELAPVLALFATRSPEIKLTPPRRVFCAEAVAIERKFFPFIQIFAPGESEFGYSLSWPENQESQEHVYRFYIDIWLDGKEPEELYFELLRYKAAVVTTLRNNMNLDGLAYGCLVRNTSNNNLMGGGHNLVISARLHFDVLAPAFLDYPKIDGY